MEKRAKRSLRWIYLPAFMLCLCTLMLSACEQATGANPGSSAQPQGRTSTLTYVAIGASDSFGMGTSDPYTENWPTDLATLLGPHVHLINLGVPGMTMHPALTAELPIAIDAHPDLITIWLAVNDLAINVPVNSYSRDLNTMLSRLQAAAPHARIAVGNVPDLTSLPFFATYNQVTLRQQIKAYNAVIASAVQRHHVILVDLSTNGGYNLREFPQYISSDGLHPSAAGYFQLAELFFQALEKK